MKRRLGAARLGLTRETTAMPAQTFATGPNAKAQENNTLSYEGYIKVWGDEFDGDSLNRDDWNVETHEKGWVNSELQEYVDSEENIQVKDGKLVINPVKKVSSVESKAVGNLLKNSDFSEGMEGWTQTIANRGGETGSADASAKEVVSYTSGRVSTQNKQTFTYGRFECRAKVPKGQGYLPAFWLMANDENLYGQWPRCGEIDCMEVMGQETNKAYGTVHYGNPHAQSQGTYYTGENESDFSDDFHVFTCDWEPGKITWYVDGVKYHEENDWYSTTVGQGTLAYPAPFDQPFYIILNLAVGGSWVGNPNDETSFENNPYEIDYVRVYQKDSYNEDVKRPVK